MDDVRKNGWHWSVKTGKYMPCQATKRKCALKDDNGNDALHFDSEDDARVFQHNVYAEKYGMLKQLTKKEKEDQRRTHKGSEIPSSKKATFTLLEKLNLLNSAKLGSEMREVNLVHETVQPLSDVSEIKSYDSSGTVEGVFSSKPLGVLWLSPAVESSGSAWRDGLLNTLGKSSDEVGSLMMQRVSLKDDAVVLELNEYNYHNLSHLFDDRDDAYHFSRSYERKYSSDPYDRVVNIPWDKLLENGVDVIHVNGDTEREYFYGYDVDSYFILNTDSVESID